MSKKIRAFVTGFGPCHCRPQKTRMKIWNTTEAVQAGLDLLGYEVTRKIGYGVTVNDFDLLCVTPGNYGSITSDYGPHAMVLMYQALEVGIPVITVIEDWQFPKFRPAFQRLASPDKDRIGKWLKYKDRKRGGTLGYKHIETHQRHMIHDIAVLLGFGQWPNPIIAVLPWHDKPAAAAAIGTTPDKMHFVDPSALYPYRPDRTLFNIQDRKREWILATLYNFRPWLKTLGLTWPVRYVGKKVGGKNIAEEAVAQMYTECWGNLSPENRWSHFGLCKNRYIHSARAGGILLAGRVMMDKIGWPYKFNPRMVEELPDYALKALAADQAKRFFGLSWTKDQYIAELHKILISLNITPGR